MRHIQLDVYRRRWALAIDVDKPPEEWLTLLAKLMAPQRDCIDVTITVGTDQTPIEAWEAYADFQALAHGDIELPEALYDIRSITELPDGTSRAFVRYWPNVPVSDSIDFFFPAPSWVFHSLTTGHAHMVWTIDPVTTGPKGKPAPQDFAQDIQASLAHIFGADTGYKAHMTYNPLYKRYLLVDYSRGDNLRLQDNLRAGEDEGVIHVFDPNYLKPRTLGQLHAGLRYSDLWEDSSEARRKAPKKGKRVSIPRREVIRKGERNVAIFEEARLDPRDPFIVAHEINDSGRVQPPLRHSEVDGIARSIQGYRAKKGHKKTSGGGLILSDQQRATLSQWGHKGGSRNTEAQKEARRAGPQSASVIRSAEAVGRRAQIRELKAQGYTNKKICELLGIERTTVYRALKD